ncbi:transposase [Streptomyces sp. NPDC029216]|uniref:transposase n=1 Tax=Streptomyces sp. NPDC029216 TaxID=3154701 RepID=UPI0033CD239C
MAKRKNYPEEFKRDAVDLVRSSPVRSLTDIAHGLGIHLETLRKWVRENLARAQAAGVTPAFRTGDDTVIRLRFVDEHRNAHRVKRMCDVLRWDRSGYYTWHQNKEARREKADEEEGLARRIREIHTDYRGPTGPADHPETLGPAARGEPQTCRTDHAGA